MDMTSYVGYYNGLFVRTKAKLKKGQQVLITPVQKNEAAGCLHKYADVSKIKDERNAFEKAVVQRNI